MLSRTPKCRHTNSCYENVIAGFIRNFVYAFGFKLLFSSLPLALKPSRFLTSLVSAKFQEDNLRFALFLAGMNAVYKTVLCFLRRVVESDAVAAPIAGFFAGLCIKLEARGRRKLLTVLLLSRTCDIAYSLGEARGLCWRITGGAVAIWCMANMS